MSEQKRFLRAQEGRVVGGVCQGLAQYIGVDVIWVRIAFVLLAVNGLGVWIYFLLWLLIPDQAHRELSTESAVGVNAQDIRQQMLSFGRSVGVDNGAMLVGLVLVLAGGLLLLGHFFPPINLSMLWPLLLIGFGAVVLLRRQR